MILDTVILIIVGRLFRNLESCRRWLSFVLIPLNLDAFINKKSDYKWVGMRKIVSFHFISSNIIITLWSWFNEWFKLLHQLLSLVWLEVNCPWRGWNDVHNIFWRHWYFDMLLMRGFLDNNDLSAQLFNLLLLLFDCQL